MSSNAGSNQMLSITDQALLTSITFHTGRTCYNLSILVSHTALNKGCTY